jgi:hypothetical protein
MGFGYDGVECAATERMAWGHGVRDGICVYGLVIAPAGPAQSTGYIQWMHIPLCLFTLYWAYHDLYEPRWLRGILVRRKSHSRNRVCGCIGHPLILRGAMSRMCSKGTGGNMCGLTDA